MARRPSSSEPHRVVCLSGANGLSRALDGRLLTASFGGKQVSLWNVADGSEVGSFGTGTGVVCWLAAQSSRGEVAAGFGDLSLRLWNPVTSKQRTLGTTGGIIASLAWSADGRWLFTGNCGDNTVRLWDVDSGEVVASATTRKSATWQVAMSADASRAVSGSGDKGVHVWEPRTGKSLGALEGHTGKILWLSFLPDGRRVISASQDKSLRLWDLETMKELLVLGGHTKQVACVAISPDGALAASCSSDGTVRFWNTSSGACERTFSQEGLIPSALEFSADGKELFVAWADSKVRGYAVQPRHAEVSRDVDSLFSAVWSDPKNDAPRAVLADVLSGQGDPRGEFITLQLNHARGEGTVASRKRERDLLTKHQTSWVGPIAPLIESTHVTFERGFVVECRLRMVKETKAPRRHPAWSTVERFSMSSGAPVALAKHLESLGAKRLK